MAARIGFVGAGAMGHGMAARILDADYALTVIAHRNRAPIDDLIARGASEAYSYTELAGASDIVVLCVSNSRIVENVVAEIKPSLRAGTAVIDTGTSSPDSTRVLAAEFAEIDVTFVEAPVTGGVKQSAAGELGALVGADHDAFARVEPLLRAFCKTVHHFGAPGAGNTAKLLNNLMVFGIAALVTESFTKAAAAGIDWQKLYDVVICGSADSGVLRRIVGAAVHGDFKGYVFDIEGSLKDMCYFCQMSEQMGGVTPLADAVRDIYEQAVAAGHGERLLSELLAPEVRAD